MEIRDNEHLKKVAINFQNVDFYCGWCAGCVETCILFPLNKMTFRQQLYGLVLKDAITQVKILFYNLFVKILKLFYKKFRYIRRVFHFYTVVYCHHLFKELLQEW